MLSIIKEFTDINSVSGNEAAIRTKIIEKITPLADNIKIDTMGNIIAFKKGKTAGNKKIIACAHMDEVGFIIFDVTEEGFLKFKSVGGIDPRIMLAQHVLIGENEVKGVIGIKAVHLQSADERSKTVAQKDMYIDIGASSKEEALKLVNKGDYASFDSKFVKLGGDLIKAKALDDRVGCAIICELMKYNYNSDLYFCFSVQEEVGLRGARVIAKRLNADAAIVFEGTTCSDIAGMKPHEFATVCGNGPVISIMDRASYSDKYLNKFICDIAKENGICFQFKQSAMGGNDAGSYQTAAMPCKTAVISLPCRYIHSPVSCASIKDAEKMLDLSKKIFEKIHTFSDLNRSEN